MSLMTRRVVLGGVGALIGSVAVLAGVAGAKRRFFNSERPLGVQLGAVQDPLSNRLDDTLAQLARIGYRWVESNRLSLSHSPADFRRALERAGLSCKSMHVPMETIPGMTGPTLASNFSQTIDDAQSMGVHYIVVPVPMIPERLRSLRVGESVPAFYARATQAMTQDEWRAVANRLSEAGARLARAGLKLGYHNHAIEFAPLGNATILDFLVEQTDPGLVCFQMDVAWVTAAGTEPTALLEAHPGRFRLMHIKEVVKTSSPAGEEYAVSAAIGSVRTNWLELLEAASKAGVEEYLVEQEPPFTGPPLESLAKSFRYLAQL